MTILQALDRYYDRMAADNDVVAPGWSTEPIGVVLQLAEDGTLRAVIRNLNDKNKPRTARVPKWFSRAGKGSTPNFLWDNAAYVLGLGSKDPAKTGRDHAAFVALHQDVLAQETDPGLIALRGFLARWSPDQGLPPGLDDKLLAFNIAFQFGAETRLLHDRPAAKAHVERLRRSDASGPVGFCLVRGEHLPLVRLHPKIKGVDGAASAEVPLVSFNVDAFTSYGKKQGFNAPTSELAAFRYGAALNALLTRGGRHRLRIADTSVAFWADAGALDASVAEACALAAEDAMADIFDVAPAPPVTTDAEETSRLRHALLDVAAARARHDVTPELLAGVRFHVLGLAPNAARIVVRYWLSDSFAVFAAALDRHAAAIAITPAPWGTRPPAIQYLLLRTTALLEKFANVPAGLAAAVTRAILTGVPYPHAWLAAVVTRLRAGDDPGRGWHAAAIKACLSRTEREAPVPVGLDPDNPSPAYQLGRLFAVMEAAQREALGRVNATIADRYYGAASATPARVFGALLRSAQTHASDARKRGRGLWVGPRLEQIIARLPPDLPTSLRLEDQGRFAVGYYHERAFRPAKPADGAEHTEQETP